MKTVSLATIVRECDRLLKPGTFVDYDGAVNGLQVENRRGISHIAAAVDATRATIRLAAKQGANLLLVHHGLFWDATHPWTGRHYELIRLLLESDLAVYSMHLPLDAHPTLGNAAGLARALRLRQVRPFFMEKGRHLGRQGLLRISRATLGEHLERVLGAPPTLLAGGGDSCLRIGICTGGAGSHMKTAAAEGVDTFITGEGPHWTHSQAEDLGLNVFYGGHYATETFGVKSLATALSQRFRIPWSFVDHPSGL
ncbi:MAG: Nif3-like dinuclear metal center hexameric protein [Pedosphaera sp.]|nr:Nif3-like dinuclear metal center hexameric protein [Pedosphaera sp.]